MSEALLSTESTFDAAERELGLKFDDRINQDPFAQDSASSRCWIVRIYDQIKDTLVRMGYTTQFNLLKWSLETRKDLSLQVKAYKAVPGKESPQGLLMERQSLQKAYGFWNTEDFMNRNYIPTGATGYC